MINLSMKAAMEIMRLQAEESQSPDARLRVAVVGGGCSGMSYKISFDATTPDVSDKTFESNGIEIVVDARSSVYLQGMGLDFTTGLNGTGFTFSNPNAKRTCGCGSSFS